MDVLDAKLIKIYNFLKEHRQYNKHVQIGEYRDVLVPYAKVNDKVYSLLYHVLNTQSQVKMDESAKFFRKIANKDISSMQKLINVLNGVESQTDFENLFKALRQQPSWGNKTSALFVKAVYQCHIGYAKQLKFWDDVPTKENTGLYLPVDAVIMEILKKLGLEKTSFNSINKKLSSICDTRMEVWDDLWFWGFITQRSDVQNIRNFGWNEAKYWNLKHSSKQSADINKIEKLANRFIKLL